MKSIDPSVFEFAQNSEKANEYFKEKLGFNMSQTQLKEKMDNGDEDFQVLDVRHADAYSESRIPGAINIDADNLENEWHKFDKNKINVIYCYGPLCHRGLRVCLAAALKGYPVMDLNGNFEGWVDYPYPVEK